MKWSVFVIAYLSTLTVGLLLVKADPVSGARTERQQPVASAPCVPSKERSAFVEVLRREVTVAKRRLAFARGQDELAYGKPLPEPSKGFEAEEVQQTMSDLATVGELHFLQCDAYPCRGVWDVRGVDTEAAQAALDALRGRYPTATIGWSESREPPLAGTVGFIIHDQIDREGGFTEQIGRVRTLSRMSLREFEYIDRGREDHWYRGQYAYEQWGVGFDDQIPWR